MFKKETVVNNQTGFHARPASVIVQFLKKYPNDIQFIIGEKAINPKSIIGILGSGLSQGDKFMVQVEGTDAQKIGDEIIEFIEHLED